ncbi:MAG: serine protease AprX [Parvicellaceae bacterium]|jgi:serine protease AprX
MLKMGNEFKPFILLTNSFATYCVILQHRLKNFITILLIFISLGTFAQDKYWVFFADKNGVEFNAAEYFHPKAIERRTKINYPLDHYSDRPVVSQYVDQVSALVDEVKMTSRWLNAAVVIAFPEQIKKIKQLDFVIKTEFEPYDVALCLSNEKDSVDKEFEEQDLIRFQVERMGGQFFDQAGYRGKGKTIAILDAGFPGVDKSDLFKHIRERDGIKGTYDFIRKTKNVYKRISHGSTVLSCVGGILDDTVRIGMATDADFLLAITEKMMKEGSAEEEAWLAAAEWADKNGADIINTSLGYTRRNYFKEEMDGKTAIISRAANMASSKGILVIASAGNEGNKKNWIMVAAPADGDSVLAIGAINPWSGLHTTFSSFGPSSDKDLKPNVTAIGHVIAYNDEKKMTETQGTSFSAPLTAGFAACAWEANPELTNWELLKRIEKSGDLYPYFDYAHGYGVPQSRHFIKDENVIPPLPDSIFYIEVEDDILQLSIREDFMIKDTLEQGRDFNIYKFTDRINRHIYDRKKVKIDADHPFVKKEHFYYHVENDSVFLDEYSVLSVRDNPILTLNLDKMKGKTLRFHYRGYTQEMKIEE